MIRRPTRTTLSPFSMLFRSSKLQAVPIWMILLVVQAITGAVVSMRVTVWLLWAELPRAPGACHVWLASQFLPQWAVTLVTVPNSTRVKFVPPLSVTVGRSKLQALPISMILLVVQEITGEVVSMRVTVWVHWGELPQASVACHVRVASKVLPQ